MAQLNATQTSEQLMILKGTRDKLATLDVTPGAIYFTTDYPGIYVDFAAEGEVGDSNYKAARRARMGDVTIVNSFDELKALAKTALKDGFKLGKDTLYYVKTGNVLCIYDETEEKFIWINDVSQLQSDISDLEGRMDDAETDIDNLQTAIGDSSTSTAGDGSVYGAIAQLASDFGDTTDGLQDQIDEILGDGSGSIGDLQDQIDAIKTDIADNVKADIADLQTADEGHESRLDTIEEKLEDIAESADENVIESITVEITGKNDPSVTIDSNTRVAAIVLPKDLSKYDTDNVLGGIDDSITDINEEITAIKGTNWDKSKPTIQGNADAVAALKGNTTGYTDATVSGNASNIAALKGNTAGYTNATVSGNASNIATLKGNVSGYTNATVTGNASDIDSLETALETAVGNLEDQIEQSAADTNADLTDKINTLRQDLTDKINDDLAAADAMTFKGGVGFKTGGEELNLPTDNVKAGDTYVIECDEEDYTPGEVTQYHAGDMMIAKYDQPAYSFKSAYVGPKDEESIPADLETVYYLGTNVDIIYVEYIDNVAGNYTNNLGINAGNADHNGVTFGACGYAKDEKGRLTPILLTNWGGGGSGYDYGQVAWYRGTAVVSGITYDLWQYSERSNGKNDYTYTRYYYTNVITQENHEYPIENWTHVKTGYDGVHESKLSVSSGTGNKIQLTSHVGVDLGSVSFESESTNIAVSKDTTNGAIKFNLVWGTF